MKDLLYLSASADAVDAALMTKEHAVTAFAVQNNLDLSKIGVIGDSTNDLPFLKIPKLGMRASPANAQATVRAQLAQLDNNILLSSSFTEAFIEFYDLAERRGMSYVFADKDGVLVWRDNAALGYKHELSLIFRSMGTGPHPFVFILTGSSYEQNLDFIETYRSGGVFAANPRVQEFPFIFLVENGAVQIDALTGETREDFRLINPVFLKFVKGQFEKGVFARVEEEVMPRFGLQWGNSANDQVERLWRPRKRTMITVNLPRKHKDESDFRTTPRGEEVRREILNCMIKEAQFTRLRYSVL